MARIAPGRGLLLWDDRQKPGNLDSSLSSYTEGTTQPGHVTYEAGQLLQPIISGGQGASVDVKVVKAGFPTTTGCRVQWRQGAETAWTGWTRPDVLMHHAYADYTTTEILERCDITLLDATQTPVIVYHDTNVNTTVYSRSYSHDSSQWSSERTVMSGQADVCGVVALEGGRLICCAYDDALGGELYYSDDDGATWAAYSTSDGGGGRPVSSGYGTAGMSMSRVGTDLVAFIVDTSNNIAQIASDSLGARWTEVADVATVGAYISSAPMPGGKVALVYRRNADSYPAIRILASAFQSFSDADEIVIVSTACDQVVCVADPNGGMYAYVRFTEVLKVYRSADDGQTWSDLGQVVDLNDTGTYPIPTAATWMYGSAMLICTQIASPATNDGSLSSYRFGGWEDHQQTAAWDFVYLPIDLPHNTGTSVWTDSGAGTASLSVQGLNLSTSSNNRDWYYVSNASTDREVMLDFRVVSGGSAASPPTDTSAVMGARIRFEDGTDEVDYYICLTTTGFTVYDNKASALVAQVTVDCTTRLQVCISETTAGLEDPAIRYKRPWARTWTDVTLTSSLTSATGVVQSVEFGHLANGTAESRWHMVALREDGGGAQVATRGKAVGSGNAIPDAGTSTAAAWLRLAGGPGVEGETYDIDVEHSYPIEALHPVTSPSPAARWRSSSNAAQTIVWDMGEGMQTYVGDAVGLYVDGGPPRQIVLEWYDASGGGSWESAGTLDLATDFTGLTYDRAGNIIYPDGATSDAGRYLQENELAGGYVEDTGNSWARRIKSNTAGWWSGSHSHTPIIVLEDVDDGADPATGTCQLVAPRGVLVRHLAASVYDARYWRITIAQQDLPEDYIRCGIALLGRVLAFGSDPSWDWSDDLEPNVQREASRSGTVRSRQQGPNRGRWVWAWSDGLDMQEIREISTDTDYIGRAGGRGLATAETVWTQLRGVLSRQAGGAHPVVGLRTIPTAVSSTVTDPTLLLYGELVSGVGWRSVLGEEGSNEIGRLEGLTIEGLV